MMPSYLESSRLQISIEEQGPCLQQARVFRHMSSGVINEEKEVRDFRKDKNVCIDVSQHYKQRGGKKMPDTVLISFY
jgi:hypothetical protein